MKNKDLLKQLEGTSTIEAIMSNLKVSKQKAVYYVHRLRKQGYVKTQRLSDKKRVYDIRFENKIGGQNYEDILSNNSPIKLARWKEHFIHGEVPFEEVVIHAIKTKSIRYMLAALALFKKIHDWRLLYRLAKENNLRREVGALYDLARTVLKTRRMDRTFLKNSLPKKDSEYRYIISGLSSANFKSIEDKWKVYLPFNRADLEDYL